MTAARNSASQAYGGARPLSNRTRGGGGSVVVKLIFLAAICAAGFFGWKQFKAYKARLRPAPPPAVKPVVVEELPPEPPRKVAAKPKKPLRKRRLTEAERDELAIQQFEEEERRKKALENDPAEIERRRQEALKRQMEADAAARRRFEEVETARKAALDQIAAARKDPAARTLPGLKGIRFGTVQDGVASAWGPILDGDSVDKSGITYAVYGAPVAKPVGTLEARPLVWVTPKTRRAFRIEFFRAIKRTPRNRHDAETASLVDMMKGALKRDPVVLHASDPDLAGAEYVFPSGETTVRVGEYGDRLKLIAEHEGLRQEAKAEADELRKAAAVDESDDNLLISTRYPQGPAVNYKGLISRFREGTPKSFCGLIFGRQPPEGATIVNPKNGEKGFYLDYGRAKCPAFKGFTVGKADIDRYRGGVFAVTLYNSEGGQDGLDDAAYFKSVRDALDRQYLVKPEEKAGTREFPELVYQKGDVCIVFGPNHNGGFRLRAENQVLADIAKLPPASPRGRR